jgi:hypothetical protein
MRSKPAIQTVRANQSTNAGASMLARTAIQPPAAAMPSVKPRIQCEVQVKRFV